MTRLELRDNGRGYPDVTAGDGVYSGYLPNLPEGADDEDGRLFVSVEVTAINAGSARIPVFGSEEVEEEGRVLVLDSE